MRQQIYRLENAEGKGPFTATYAEGRKTTPEQDEYFYGFPKALGWLEIYNFGEDEDFLSALLGVTSRGWKPDASHPHHMTDVPPPEDYDDHTWKVGCKDMEQLEHWFPPQSFDFLTKWGFELVIYDCEYVHFGQYQVLFCTDDAIEVERKPLA